MSSRPVYGLSDARETAGMGVVYVVNSARLSNEFRRFLPEQELKNRHG